MLDRGWRKGIAPGRGVKRSMVIYRFRTHRRIYIWLAAAATFVATLALLWTDAGGIS